MRKIVKVFLIKSACSKTDMLAFDQGDLLRKNLTSGEPYCCVRVNKEILLDEKLWMLSGLVNKKNLAAKRVQRTDSVHHSWKTTRKVVEHKGKYLQRSLQKNRVK